MCDSGMGVILQHVSFLGADDNGRRVGEMPEKKCWAKTRRTPTVQ